MLQFLFKISVLANAGQSKYIKFADGQTMKLHFYPERTTTFETTFNGKREKPTTRFKFMVTEHDNAADIPLEQQDAKEWETGSEVAKELNDYFNENKVDFEITRKGLDTSTKYRIVPMTTTQLALLILRLLEHEKRVKRW